jgi:molecular chaperone IbpA
MTFDFSPLYRSAVGFDNLASLLDSITANERNQPSYPPYNIELLEQDKYRITMAVAGFGEEEIAVQAENNTLTVAATRSQAEGETKPRYLHQGIAERSFRRQFRLADHVKVVSANLANGLLHIYLEKEIPETMKPRQIPINGAKVQQLLRSGTEG